MDQHSKIYVAGHRGMVGNAIVRELQNKRLSNLVLESHAELDLTRQTAVEAFFETEKPDYVFLAAARVGGILANSTYPAEFIYQNMMIEMNVIHAAWQHGVKKLLFLGSSCIYPRLAPQPIPESALLTGELEKTNEAYALAKISGLKMCEFYRQQYGCDFISAMPTNLYGPGDNFHPTNSHVIPALIRKFHEAKVADKDQVEIWGTGKPMREFLYVDDLAKGLFFLMEHYSDAPHVNIGTGEDLTIAELAETVKQVVGFEGRLVFDAKQPDGTPRKVMNVSRINALGWKAATPLKVGLRKAYDWALDHGVFDGET
ncbi:MAG: GDP-L-fucose synthase [Kiritimatiellia bacterium]|nr:GDP-L-fucose synthase [Kiritimatiellia bacterium]